MPRSRRRRSPSRRRSTAPRSRRRRNATKLKLYAAQGGQMPEKTRTVAVKVSVGRNRMATSREHAFMACATFAKHTECSESHNPSAAIGRVLAKIGNATASRPSSFAGLGGTRKRRRKSRR